MMKLIIGLLFSGILQAQAHPQPREPRQPQQPQPQQTISPEDQAFLDAHNIRRDKFHRGYGVSYVPLRHSPGLKQAAMKWASILAHKVCNGATSIYHDPNNEYGENIASNKGSGSWGKRPEPEKIIYRFVDKELNQKNKGHLTQVLWRPTKYVGCAIAVASPTNNDKVKCHITVCRYAKPGNCNMGGFPDWKSATYRDNSGCGPDCPPEGCR